MVRLLSSSMALEISVVIISIILMVVLSILLFLSIKKEHKRLGMDAKREGMLSTKEFDKLANKWISGLKRNGECHVFQVDIREYDSLVKNIGQEQYDSIFKQIANVLIKLQPFGVRVSKKQNDSIYLIVRSGGQYDNKQLCDLILKNVSKISKVGEMNIDVKINIASVTAPQDATDIDQIKKLLDITMIKSRRKGTNKTEFYSITFANESSQEYIYYQEIKNAIRTKEFNLFYQPVVDIETMEVVNAETFMRWFHKTRGVLRPNEFLSVMEQTGDINWVGQWCFEQLLIQHSVWKKNYEQRFTIAYNLSERQLSDPNMPETFNQFLKKSKANASDYILEVGESIIHSSSKIVTTNLEKLTNYGFKIAFDGFGVKTFSPLALVGLNVASIKIEHSFWSKSCDDRMLKQMLDMLVEYSLSSNITLIASGVENITDVKYLKDCGIRYMQGYLFDKPKDSKDFIAGVLLTPWDDVRKSLI